MKKILLFISILSATNVYALQSTSLTAVANQGFGQPNKQFAATGYVSYNLHNTSSSTQTYHIDEYMCVNNSQCSKIHYDFNVGAGQTKSGQNSLVTYATEPAGTWEDEATISVYGYETAQAKGVSSISVH